MAVKPITPIIKTIHLGNKTDKATTTALIIKESNNRLIIEFIFLSSSLSISEHNDKIQVQN